MESRGLQRAQSPVVMAIVEGLQNRTAGQEAAVNQDSVPEPK